jgi:uncharacterized membrane protein YtjA (UPF0391 family)
MARAGDGVRRSTEIGMIPFLFRTSRLLTGLLGFTELGGAAVNIAKLLFIAASIVFVLLLVPAITIFKNATS